jgi:uncharacterized protein (DUF952 family)
LVTILHIVPRFAWEQAQLEGVYRGDTLDAEGFIHFSTPEQVIRVANARFKGHTGLLLAVVDTETLQAELKYESPYEGGQQLESDELFPHLYGALNLDAVIRVVEFEPQEDGTFTLPNGLG